MVTTNSNDSLRLEAAGHIDVATLLPVEISNLPRGVHARCIAFHPQKPLLAVGVQTCVGGYDLINGIRVGRVDIRTPAVALMFSRDGSLLVVATQEWHIVGINTATWRSRVLAPMTEPRTAPLDSIMMAVTGGSRPVIFFTRYGKNSVRMAVNTGAVMKKSTERKLKWGVKLKLDVNKAVAGLAAHPTASQLLVLYEDGSLRSYAMSSTGLQSLWPAGWMLPGDAATLGRLSLSQLPCQTLNHPFVEGAALLAIGSGTGSLLVLELVGRAEPVVVLKAVMPGNMPIVGLGVQQAEHVLFVFTTDSAGKLRVLAWQMSSQPQAVTQSSGLTFERMSVDADDLDATVIDYVSSHKSTKPLPSSNGSNGIDWQSLWGSDGSENGIETAADGSFLLDKLLAPVVQTAVIHPTLGCVAVQRAPPLALRQAATIMQQRIGHISAPEAAISRRTASVPLLRLLHAGQPGVAWPGNSVAVMHTGLNFWQTAAGMGPAKLQFPCHLYYLGANKLSKYSLASKKSGCFVQLPPTNKAGQHHQAKHLVHSSKQHAWLVFFQSQSGPSGRNSVGGTEKGRAAAAVGKETDSDGWSFTLVTDTAGSDKASWVLPGKSGVFLGPQDLYFGIMQSRSNSLSVYRTLGFRGKGLPLYTISLARPSSLGAGLFAGPAALAAPFVGAEAAAKAAKEAAEAADKAVAEAAETAAADGEASTAAGDADASAAAAQPGAASSTAGSANPSTHIRRPGETWRPTDDDGDNESAGDMMLPVIGIGAAYQHAGQGGKGPNRFMAPGYGQQAQEDVQQDAPGEKHSGGGVVLWHQAGGKLVMGGLPAPGVQYAAGEDSDDPDAAETDETAAIQAPDLGQVACQHSLQLQPNERVVSLSWQSMTQHEPLEPHQCAAAILTTQRLLLVSGDLTLLAAIDASCGSVGLSNAITSYLWVGPALLYMTVGGQVMQLTWTGQTQHMASVASYPPAVLGGALADSLLLLRQNPATGEQEVASRAVGLLQPQVLGWTSLASCGLLPRGLNTARAALQALLEAFDATHVTSGMLWALIQGWCGDVAAALASHAADVEPSVQMAANAAAGRWPAVVSALRAEHERSIFYPKPAPPCTELHQKLLAAAAGAIMHGQFSCAQECLEAAGEWETAMALAVCAGDFAALRNLAVGLQAGTATAAGGAQEAADIARLARALVAAYERNGRAFHGSKASDWKLRPMMADDSFFSNASDWSFGGPGKLPAMETSSFNAPAAFIQDGEVGPVPRADTATLGAYLGNSDLVLDESAGVVDKRPESRNSMQEDFMANLDQLVALSSQRRDGSAGGVEGLKRAGSAASSISSEGPGAATAAAASGSAAGTLQRDPFGLSDDDDDEEVSFGYTQRTKFKIHIKSKEELDKEGNPAAAGATGASAAELRGAVSKLKLGPPGTPGGSFKDAFGKGPSKLGESARQSIEGSPSRGSAGGASDSSLYDLSFLTPGTQRASSSTSPGGGLPPRAPASSSGGAAGSSTGGLASLSSLTGIAPGLGGPAMKPKPQASPPSDTPVISDEDFFSALAPVILHSTKSKLLSPPPPPTAAAASSPGSAAAAAGGGATRSPPRSAAAGAAAGVGGLGASRLSPPQAVKLAPPSGTAAAAAESKGTAGAGIDLLAAGPPAAPAAATGNAAAEGAVLATGGDSTTLYLNGVSEMETARWDDAIATFSQTLQVLMSDPPGPATQQKQAFAAQYLAAVMLLKAAGAGATAKEAKLYRYACGLQLDDRHRLALVKESVVRNKHVGNFRYAADQLTWLVTRSLGNAPMDVMARLQEDIDECDRKGGRNADIDADEKVDEWVSIVTAGVSRQDVEEMVLPLIQAAV